MRLENIGNCEFSTFVAKLAVQIAEKLYNFRFYEEYFLNAIRQYILKNSVINIFLFGSFENIAKYLVNNITDSLF